MLSEAGLKVSALPDGTNLFTVQLAPGIADIKMQSVLSKEHRIAIGRKAKDGLLRIKVNETILFRDNNKLLQSFKDAVKSASA